MGFSFNRLNNWRRAAPWIAGFLLGLAAFVPPIVAWFTSEELSLIYMVRDNPFGVWSGLDGIAGFFRPVVTIIIWAVYNLFGLEPRPFHLVNVVLHLVNSVMVYAIARGWCRMLPDGHRLRRHALPAVAALWFWVWPSHSEPVSWIPALTDVSAATFGLASIAAYVHGRNHRNVWWGAAALVLYAIALCAKESVISLPGVVFFYEASRWWMRRDGIVRGLVGTFAFGFVMLGYFQVRYLLLGAYVGGYGTAMHTDFSWERLQWTVSPNLMNAFLPLPMDDVHQKNFVLLVLAGLATAAVSWRRWRSGESPVVVLSIALAAVVAFLPAFNLGPHFITEGQRFSYLSSAFGVMGTASVVCYLVPRGKILAVAAWVVAIAAAALLGFYNANWYYAGKVARKAARGMKQLPEARRLYVLTTTKAYREAFILPHSLDTVAKLMTDGNSPAKEYVMCGAVTYWNPTVDLAVTPATAGATTYTLTMAYDPAAEAIDPRLEPFGIGLFAEPVFEATGGGNSIQVVLHGYDPAVDKVGYLDGGKWVILP